MKWLKKCFGAESDAEKKLGDHEMLNFLIRLGLEDKEMKTAIFKLTNMSTDNRSAGITLLLSNLRNKQAPKELMEAILSLKEEEVAKRANTYLTRHS